MAEQVHSITGAQQSTTEDQAPRTRRYLISMGIRTACVIAAIIVPGWPRWVLIAGAVILPYIAVVAANAGRGRRSSAPPAVTPPVRPQLTASPATPVAASTWIPAQYEGWVLACGFLVLQFLAALLHRKPL